MKNNIKQEREWYTGSKVKAKGTKQEEIIKNTKSIRRRK